MRNPIFRLTASNIAVSRVELHGPRRFQLEIGEVDIRAGDRIALCGPNGSGKTTALSVLSLVLPANSANSMKYETPAGTSTFGFPRNNASQRSARYLQRKAISVVQHAGNDVPFLKVRDRIKARLMLAGKSATSTRIRTILKQLGLETLANAHPSELSQGQRQRLSLATAIAAPGSILFADEPTAALDEQWSEEALHLLSGLALDHGIAVLMSTHDPDAAARHGFCIRNATTIATNGDMLTKSQFSHIGS